MPVLGKKRLRKKVSTVQLAFSLACCRNVGQLWQWAPTHSLRYRRGSGQCQGLVGGRNSLGPAASRAEGLQQAALGEAESLCLEHGLEPNGLFVPELLAVIFHCVLAQRKAFCSELVSSQAVCSVALVGSCCVASPPSWQVQAPLLSCLDLRLWGYLQSCFSPPSLSFPCRCLRSFWSSERQNIASFTTVSTRELKVADGCYSFQFPAQIKKKIFYLNYHSFGLFPVLRLKISFF